MVSPKRTYFAAQAGKPTKGYLQFQTDIDNIRRLSFEICSLGHPKGQPHPLLIRVETTKALYRAHHMIIQKPLTTKSNLKGVITFLINILNYISRKESDNHVNFLICMFVQAKESISSLPYARPSSKGTVALQMRVM